MAFIAAPYLAYADILGTFKRQKSTRFVGLLVENLFTSSQAY